jgi:hypothetical protein
VELVVLVQQEIVVQIQVLVQLHPQVAEGEEVIQMIQVQMEDQVAEVVIKRLEQRLEEMEILHL